MTAASAAFGGTRRSALREFGSSVVTIMVKELRSRMRGRRAFIVLTVYLGILALITYGTYVTAAETAAAMSGFGAFPAVGFEERGFAPAVPMPIPDGGALSQANASAVIGQAIFSVLSIFQLILVAFIAPAFTSGQISMEREKQTLDLLITTPMRPAAIVVGKLAAALAFVVLMIVAAIPITAIVLMYGGASIDDIVRQQVVLLATAVALGAIGLFFSALIKRTQTATVLTYITMLALTLGSLMLFAFWTVVANQDDRGPFGRPEVAPEQLLYVNPGIAMLDVVSNTEAGVGPIGSVLAAMRGEEFGFGGGMACNGNVCFPVDQFGNPIDDEIESTAGYWWPRVSLTFLGLALVLTFLSTRLVVPATRPWSFRRLGRPRRGRSLDSPAPGVTIDTAAEGAPTIEELRSDATPPASPPAEPAR